MRLLKDAERSFTERIVEDIHELVESPQPLDTKLEKLNLTAKEQEHKINFLVRLARRLRHDETRLAKIKRVIGLREKAASYVQAMGRFLKAKEKKTITLDQSPCAFATPPWEETTERA